MKQSKEKKYTGALGNRRKPSELAEMLGGLAALLKLSEPQYKSIQSKLEQKHWPEQLLHDMEGIKLLCDHYGLSAETDPTIKFLMLAIFLAREHVPYYMQPTRRGPPNKNIVVLPLLDKLLEQSGVDSDVVYQAFVDFTGADDRESLERQLRRYRQKAD